ncbi:MAG: hypothetical protein ACM3Q4_03330 [Acidobacteriota bacterium]
MRLIYRAAARMLFFLCMAQTGSTVSLQAQQLLEPEAKSRWRSFLETLSFDMSYGVVYGGSYHGFAAGGRIDIPLVRLPTLNRLFSLAGDSAEYLTFLPGLHLGHVQSDRPGGSNGALYAAPDGALHYSLLKSARFRLYAGPSAEFIFTNNAQKYKMVPSFGLDLGALYTAPASGLALGIEHRWIVLEKESRIMNAPDFPVRAFSHVGVVVRLALPWKSHEEGYGEAAAIYEAKAAEVLALQKLLLSVRADGIAAEASALRDTLEAVRKAAAEREASERPAQMLHTDPYNASVTTADADYQFTKDPFVSGNLVNERYLKNVLLDILDDEYVWRLSASRKRGEEAEKIRTYFVLLNAGLARRLVVAEDESVRLFKLTCLGKAAAADSGGTKNQ